MIAKIPYTIDQIFTLAKEQGLAPKRWGSSRLVTYNGFDHDQRVRKWQALDLAIRMGLENPAEKFPCSVCNAPPSPAIAYHSEDYGTMVGHYPVCKSCHTRLHNRLRSPASWHAFVARVGSDGERWFEQLPTQKSPAIPSQRQPAVPVTTARPTPPPPVPAATVRPGGEGQGRRPIQAEMHAVRTVVRAMGIPSKKMNPNPVGGYKLEPDPVRRQRYLDEARRLRDLYKALVEAHGTGRRILELMDSNLAHRDKGLPW